MMADFSPSVTVSQISEFLKERLGGKNAIVGVSGGIDSAVVVSILQRTVGVHRIHAYFLPDSMTPGTDYEDVRALSDKLGMVIKTIDISSPVESFRNLLDIRDLRFLGNVKSRVRMITLYYFSALFDGLVVGTTNRSEYLTGYFTKFGDGACDIEPVMHLYKDDIRLIARYLEVPTHIIEKKPSAGLWESQTDEEEMGLTYIQLDRMLRSYSTGGERALTGEEDGKRVLEMIRKSDHKRHPPASLMGREEV